MIPGFNKAGTDWQLLKRWIITEIDLLRNHLEHGGGDLERGQIKAFRRLIAEAEPEAPPETVDPNYDT